MLRILLTKENGLMDNEKEIAVCEAKAWWLKEAWEVVKFPLDPLTPPKTLY